MPGLVTERDLLRKQVEEMDRNAELEKDRVSKLVESMKTNTAEEQQTMQEKVVGVLICSSIICPKFESWLLTLQYVGYCE